jgi:hypothetical protein
MMEFDEPRPPHFQFSLSRLMWFVAIVAVALTAYTTMPWPLATVLLCLANLAAARFFFVLRDWRLMAMTIITAVLILGALFSVYRDPSSPLGFQAAWPWAVAAIVSQITAVGCWLTADV